MFIHPGWKIKLQSCDSFKKMKVRRFFFHYPFLELSTSTPLYDLIMCHRRLLCNNKTNLFEIKIILSHINFDFIFFVSVLKIAIFWLFSYEFGDILVTKSVPFFKKQIGIFRHIIITKFDGFWTLFFLFVSKDNISIQFYCKTI